MWHGYKAKLKAHAWEVMHFSAISEFVLIFLGVNIPNLKNGEIANVLQNNYKKQLIKLIVKHISTTQCHLIASNKTLSN